MSQEKPYMPNIWASSPDGFQKMYDKVKTLPQVIIDQIETVRSGIIGMELTYKQMWAGDRG